MASKYVEPEDTMTVVLRKPIVNGAKEVFDQLELREPTIGELQAATKLKDDFAQEIYLISAMTGISVNVVGKISLRDFQKCAKYFGSFLPDTTVTPSD